MISNPWVRPPRAALCMAVCLSVSIVASCATTSTVRLQPDAVAVAPGLRPIAGIQANATSAYLLFIPIPGGVSLDRVVNQMMVAKAKILGADKVAILDFDATPEAGIWTLRKLIGWRSARATGIAVQVTSTPPDPRADEGPEPAGAPSPSPGAAATPGGGS